MLLRCSRFLYAAAVRRRHRRRLTNACIKQMVNIFTSTHTHEHTHTQRDARVLYLYPKRAFVNVEMSTATTRVEPRNK